MQKILPSHFLDTRNKWLNEQMAVLLGTRKLAVHLVLSRLFRAFLSCFLLLSASANAQTLQMPLQAFSAESQARITQRLHHQPFVLVFWSVDCPYCIEDMHLLGEHLRAYPQIKLVTVCVDTQLESAHIHRVLDKAELPPHERWQFADDDEERLRFSIDSHWQGELPRTYFYDPAHHVLARSGKVEATVLNAWLNAWLKK